MGCKSAARDPAQEAYLAGVASSPIVFSDQNAVRSGEAGASARSATPGWLAAAQQMAEARGDAELASALAMLDETAAADAGDVPVHGEAAEPGAASGQRRRVRVQMELPLSAYEIKEGTLLPAILETAINSDLGRRPTASGAV